MRKFLTLLVFLTISSCAEDSAEIIDKQKAHEMLTARTLGLAYLEDGQLAEAKEQFEQLIEVAPDEPLGFANLGLVCLRLSEYAEAETQVNKALKIEPDNVEIRLILAKIYELSDKEEAAIAELEKGLKYNPDHVRALYALTELYRNSNQQPLAKQEELLTRLVAVAPGNLAARIQLVEVLLQNNKPDQALGHLEEMRRQMPELPDDARGFFTQAITTLQNDANQKPIIPVRVFHNLMKATSFYKGSIAELNGSAEVTVGSPILTFRQTIPREIQGTKPILDALKFTDVTESVGLNAVNHCVDFEKNSGNAGSSLAVADFDKDGDDDIYFATNCARAEKTAFLLRNDAGKFVDISIQADIRHRDKENSAGFADYDNDGFLDLYIAKDGANLLYRNNGDGAFQDVTGQTQTGGLQNSNAAIFANFDLDGDLDIFVMNDGHDQLYRKNEDGAFAERALAMQLAGDGSRTHDAVFGDFDEDGDLDLFVVGKNKVNLFSNSRLAEFSDVTNEAGFENHPGANAVAAGDYNNDGFLDLFVTGQKGQHGFYLNQQNGAFALDRENQAAADSLTSLHGHDALFFDFDNDGYLDLIVVGQPQKSSSNGIRLFHNNGFGVFKDVSFLLPAKSGAKRIATTDYDNDGDMDILLAGLDGRISLFRNDGGNANRYLKVSLVGLRAGNGKNNHFGVGAKLELRAGEHYQSQLVSQPVTHFGLGQHAQTDVVRIIWPNGVSQNAILPGTNQVLVEHQELKGSCMFLYAWNGAEFSLVTDILWRSALGMPLGIMSSEDTKIYAFANPTKEYVKIAGEKLQPRDGSYSLRITEELWETVYLDKLKLIAIDHPDSVEIYVDERFLLPPFPDLKIHHVKQKRLPLKAADHNGINVLPEIRAADDTYLSNFQPAKYQGITELHDLVLELGDFSDSDSVFLFLQGWLFPTDASINIALTQAEEQTLKTISPYLQVKNKNGGWQTVTDNIGFPMGKDKTVIVDLTGKFLTRDHRVRIRTNMEIYWDHVFYTTSSLNTASRLTELQLKSAELRYRGFSKKYRKGGRYGPHWYDYNDVSTGRKWRDLTGYYTRYGDVLPLLDEADDFYVIINSGDEVAVEYDANQLPPPPKGWTRDFLIYTEGWIKDGDLNTAHGQTVEPLPFHGMTEYPYGEGESYPADEAHQQYLEEYNTRKVTTESFVNRLRKNLD